MSGQALVEGARDPGMKLHEQQRQRTNLEFSGSRRSTQHHRPSESQIRDPSLLNQDYSPSKLSSQLCAHGRHIRLRLRTSQIRRDTTPASRSLPSAHHRRLVSSRHPTRLLPQQRVVQETRGRRSFLGTLANHSPSSPSRTRCLKQSHDEKGSKARVLTPSTRSCAGASGHPMHNLRRNAHVFRRTQWTH